MNYVQNLPVDTDEDGDAVVGGTEGELKKEMGILN